MAGLTIWWALRTPQRRGPTGKLDAEEEGVGGVSLSPANYGSWRTLFKFLIGDRAKSRQKTDLVKFELENASDEKDFGHF